MSDIKQLVEDLNKASHEIKSTLENVKGDVTKQGADFDQRFDRIVADMTKSHDAIQAKQKEMEDFSAKMQAMLERNEAQSGDDAKTKEAKKKFVEFLRDVKSAKDLEIRAMSTDSNPDGGYLVYPEIANFMATRDFETSPLRRLARVVTTAAKSIEVTVNDGSVGTRWVGEGASGGATTSPQFGRIEITAHKIESDTRITTEMAQDAYFDVEAVLQNIIARDIAISENSAFITGTGVASPKGILSYTAGTSTYVRDTIEQVNMGGASALTSDGLIAVQAALKEAYQPNATWLAKRATYGAILKLKGNDNYFFGTMLLKDGQQVLQLLGKPLVFADDMPAVAANALSIAYGDFSVGYTIVDRVGLQIMRDPFTSKGYMTYYATKRTGGAVTSFDAIKIGKVAA